MFRNRPLASCAAAFACGAVLAAVSGTVISAVILAVLGVLSVVLASVRTIPGRRTAVLLIAAAAAGILRTGISVLVYDSNHVPAPDTQIMFVGDVRTVDSYGFTAVTVSAGGTACGEGDTVRVYCDGDIAVSAGDRVTCALRLYDPDMRDLADGLSYTASGTVVSVENQACAGVLTRMRAALARRIDTYLSGDSAAISKAVLLGDRSSVSGSLYSAFRASGLAHTLVVSGLHMSLLLMTLYEILGRTGLNRFLRSGTCIVLAAFFCAFVGFTASAVRAAVMCAFVFASGAVSVRSDSFTALFVALALLITVNPYSVFSAGLQLSFLCSLGIVAVSPALSRAVSGIKRRGLRRMLKHLSPLAISASAALFSFPAVFFSFGEFSVVSPLTNFAVLPVFSAAVIIGYTGLLLPFAGRLSGFLFGLIADFAGLIDSSGIASLSTAMPGMAAAAALSAVSVLVIISVRTRKRPFTALVCAAAFVLTVAGSAVAFSANERQKVFAECISGSGCELLTVTHDGQCLAADLGGEYINSDAIYKTGHTSVDAYVITVCDEAALEKLCTVLGQFRVVTVYICTDRCDPYSFTRASAVSVEAGTEVVDFSGTATIFFGDAAVFVGEYTAVEYRGDEYIPGGSGSAVLDGKE